MKANRRTSVTTLVRNSRPASKAPPPPLGLLWWLGRRSWWRGTRLWRSSPPTRTRIGTKTRPRRRSAGAAAPLPPPGRGTATRPSKTSSYATPASPTSGRGMPRGVSRVKKNKNKLTRVSIFHISFIVHFYISLKLYLLLKLLRNQNTMPM